MEITFIKREKGGTVPKAWYAINGHPHLVKGNSLKRKSGFKVRYRLGLEPYSEAVASHIAKSLGVPHIDYTLMDAHLFPHVKPHQIHHVIVCPYVPEIEKSITLKDYLISEGVITGRDKKRLFVVYSMPKIIGALTQRNIDITPLIITLIFDALIGNQDRHLNNINLISDNQGSLQFLPIFDNGVSLLAWYNNQEIKDHLFTLDKARPFAPTHIEQLRQLKDLYPREIASVLPPQHKMPQLRDEIIGSAELVRPHIDAFRFESIVRYLDHRMKYFDMLRG